MNTHYYIYKYVAAFVCLLALSACGDGYLNVLPDNRAEVDSEDKILSLLVSAYPTHDYQVIAEYMSDNVDCMGENNPNTERFLDEVYEWQDGTETNNESPENFWQDAYGCIAAANQAMEAADEVAAESGWTTRLKQLKAEALMCRAYNHFMLVNFFAKHYNQATSESDPGITYMTHSEHTLRPEYQRNSVAECYRLIEKDILEAMPDISDSYMTVPRYHFNPKAAWAFASRFYLFYEKWDKAKEYADKVLGASPATVLRNYKVMGGMTQEIGAITQKYIDATENCNLLMHTGYSAAGLAFGNYSRWKKYCHNKYVAEHETCSAGYPWGSINYFQAPKTYNTTYATYIIFWRMPYLFEYTDAVAGTGYRHSVFVALSTDECLLNRIEAEIMMKDYDAACEDMTTWLHNQGNNAAKVNIEEVVSYLDDTDYSYDAMVGEEILPNQIVNSTIKKHLHPAFTIDKEGSVQESLLQMILQLRRIEFLHNGMRWFDVKRYGIEIPRRVFNAAGTPVKITDWLLKDDDRRAVQVPQKVRDAGYEPNARQAIPTNLTEDPDGEQDKETRE